MFWEFNEKVFHDRWVAQRSCEGHKQLVVIYRCPVHSSPDQGPPAPAAAVSRTAELPALHLQEFGLAFTQIRLSPGTANQCERNCVSPGRSMRPPDQDPTRSADVCILLPYKRVGSLSLYLISVEDTSLAKETFARTGCSAIAA